MKPTRSVRKQNRFNSSLRVSVCDDSRRTLLPLSYPSSLLPYTVILMLKEVSRSDTTRSTLPDVVELASYIAQIPLLCRDQADSDDPAR